MFIVSVPPKRTVLSVRVFPINGCFSEEIRTFEGGVVLGLALNPPTTFVRWGIFEEAVS